VLRKLLRRLNDRISVLRELWSLMRSRFEEVYVNADGKYLSARDNPWLGMWLLKTGGRPRKTSNTRSIMNTQE